MLAQPSQQDKFKAFVVQLILNKQTEHALNLLAKEYKVVAPTLEIGLPKGHSRNAYGTYNAKSRTISVMDRDIFSNPFVILHEFYHHIRSRSVDKMHRGTEKNADKFAVDYLRAYDFVVRSGQKNSSS